MQFLIKLFSLMILSFSLFSCATVPEIYLKTNNGSYWKELVKNKVASDSYQNIYRFDKNANMSLIVYGYKSKIKYTLFLMKEHNQAFYYKKFTLKNYIIESLPSLNLYRDVTTKNAYTPLYLDFSFYFSSSFKDKSIYMPIGLMVEDNKLYIAKVYDSSYKDKLRYWLRKNGYGRGREWIPAINADWSSYPIPTEHEIDWDKIEFVGTLF